MQQETIKRFWAKVTRQPNGCWHFTSSLSRLGYGQFRFDGKTHKAHRASWQIANGMIPDGQCVLHKCDVRKRVNPDHLFLGSQVENIADMVSKNRQSSGCQAGETNPMAKLDADKVREIRKLYADGGTSQHKLAAAFHIAPMTVNRIVNGTLWRTV